MFSRLQFIFRARRSVLCILWLTCSAGPAYAVELSEVDTTFLDDATITYLVGTQAGGTYDSYARLIGRHIERLLPGTRVRIRNVPGAGSIIAANMLYSARADGLTIATLNTGLVYSQLFRLREVRFDLAAMGWIGKATNDPLVLFVSRSAPVSSLAELADANREPLLLGTAGVGSLSQANTTLVSSLLDLNTRVIAGYSGQEVRLAVLRGDLHGMLGSYTALRPLFEQGYGSFILRLDGDDLPALEQVPELGSLVTDENVAEILEVMRSVNTLGRMTVTPPGVPENRLVALQALYQHVLEDPEFVTDAERLQLPLDPLFGQELSQRARALFELPENTIRQLWERVECTPTAQQCIPNTN